MESILDFLANNYIWFLIAAIVLAFALIGFIIDSKRKEKKKKTEDGIVNGNDLNGPEVAAAPSINNDATGINVASTTTTDPQVAQAPVMETPTEINNTPSPNEAVQSVTPQEPQPVNAPTEAQTVVQPTEVNTPVQPTVNATPQNPVEQNVAPGPIVTPEAQVTGQNVTPNTNAQVQQPNVQPNVTPQNTINPAEQTPQSVNVTETLNFGDSQK